MQYQHTQSASLFVILVVVGVGMFLGACRTPELVAQVILACGGALMLLLTPCFRQLTVSDEGDRLLISFGPLPLFRRRILYSNIESVARGRTTILDGWGIHLSPSGGWTWNLWGFDCVDVRFKSGGRVRIGTDDPEGLTAFLTERVRQEAL